MLDVNEVLADIDNVNAMYGANMRHYILNAFGSSIRNGWWLMAACMVIILALTFMKKQWETEKEVDSLVFNDKKSIPELEKGP